MSEIKVLIRSHALKNPWIKISSHDVACRFILCLDVVLCLYALAPPSVGQLLCPNFIIIVVVVIIIIIIEADLGCLCLGGVVRLTSFLVWKHPLTLQLLVEGKDGLTR